MSAASKILLVDDEAHIRQYLGMLLEDMLDEVEIIEAEDSPSGLAAYAEHQPSLVLLDINMIGSNGLDMLGELHASHPEAKVVMVTSVNVRKAVEDAMSKGALGYILKDAPPEQISDDLRAIIAKLG